jgi:hypothetical protein
VHACPDADPVTMRSALATLHALTVARLLSDVLPDTLLSVLQPADIRG